TAGMAYRAGLPRALEQVAGIRPADADLLVGTSAGSVIAAYLRSGWTGEDFWTFALGTHPTLAELSDDEQARRRREIFTPRWRSPLELSRIAVGSAYVLGQAVVRRPALPIPGFLRRRRALIDQPRPGRQVRLRPHHWHRPHGLRAGRRARSHSPIGAPHPDACALARDRLRPQEGRRGAADPAYGCRARRARGQPHAPDRRRGDRPLVLRRRRAPPRHRPLPGGPRRLTLPPPVVRITIVADP